MPNLIYVADPMCSWCYGFGAELSPLLQGLPEVGFKIVVGGLRAYNKEVMDAATKETILTHWKHVADASGATFSDTALQQDDFIYDTEPACRAVITARLLAPETELQVFYAIQHAFYADGLDVTQGDVLAEIVSATLNANGFPIDAASVHAKWSEEATIQATAQDFQQTRQWEISGFPTLILERNGRLDLVTSGFMRTEALIDRLQTVIEQPL